MKRTHLAVLAALVLPLAGCGSDEPAPPEPPSAGGDTPSKSAEAGASVEAAADPGELTDADVAAIADTIVTLDLEGGCDLVTDKYLEDQTFDSNPRRACTTYESGFVEKQYAAEDLLISDVTGTQRRATATFGSTIADLTIEYTLVNEDGTWKVDAVDF